MRRVGYQDRGLPQGGGIILGDDQPPDVRHSAQGSPSQPSADRFRCDRAAGDLRVHTEYAHHQLAPAGCRSNEQRPPSDGGLCFPDRQARFFPQASRTLRPFTWAGRCKYPVRRPEHRAGLHYSRTTDPNPAGKEETTMLYLPKEKGQGLVEYALILVLVAVVVIVILALLGPAIGNVFSGIVQNI